MDLKSVLFNYGLKVGYPRKFPPHWDERKFIYEECLLIVILRLGLIRIDSVP